jgi:hypothetical protein
MASLVPTLDAVALQVLAGTQSGLTLAQISRMSRRGSRQGLALALERLVHHGLVLAEPAGRSQLFRLNRDHVLADAVVSAAHARLALVERLADGCAALDPALVHASVFGSFARAEGHPDSDIDLLVVAPDRAVGDDAWRRQLDDLASDVHRWTGNRLESVCLTPADLHEAMSRGEPIARSWLADSVTILGPPIKSLAASHGGREAGHR